LSDRAFRVLTGCLALLVPALFTAGFGLLQLTWDYPAVLGRVAVEVFPLVTTGGAFVVLLWCVTLVASTIFAGLAVAMHRLLAGAHAPYLGIATTAGLLAALAQVLDISQWVFLVPRLAVRFADPSVSPAGRAALVEVYEAFHAWLGVGFGVSLATIFNGVWALLLGVAMRRSRWMAPWVGFGGLLSGGAFIVSAIPGLPLSAWFVINTVGFGFLALWLATAGFFLILRKSPPRLTGDGLE
jgi:hypothetical protein